MTREEIDRFIYAAENQIYEEIACFVDNKKIRNELLNFSSDSFRLEDDDGFILDDIFLMDGDIIEQSYKEIMAKIEISNYEYFCSQISTHAFLSKLLIYISDKEKIKNCIIHSESLGIKGEDKIKLIQLLGMDFAKECLEGKIAGIELDVGDTTMYYTEKVALISSIKEIEYIKSCIEGKIKGVELSKEEIIDLISTIDDEEYKKACLKDEIPGVELDYSEKKDIIIRSIYCGDISFIRQCIEGKVKNIEFNIDDKIEIIDLLDDEDYLRDCIEGRIKGVSLDGKLLDLILKTEDAEYIEKCIDNPEIKLSDTERLSLFTQLEIFNIDMDCITFHNIKLPKKMTIGVEIESEGEMSKFIQDHFIFGEWEAKSDGSLVNGVEIVSPILSPTEKDSQDIYKVTNFLERVGQCTPERCGGHIHIGADFLTSTQSYANLLEIWCNTEQILYTISNGKYEHPRSSVVEYAEPVTKKVQKALNTGTLELNDETELDNFIEELTAIQGDRYSGINFLNVNTGKNTIEFRLANGTINPDLWIDNINLFGGIVAIAEELTVTKDKRKLELFDMLKEDITDEEKLKSLLELIGVEPKSYEERYVINKGLTRTEKILKPMFPEVKSPIKITGKKIKEISLGASAILQQEAIDEITKEQELQNLKRTDKGIEK